MNLFSTLHDLTSLNFLRNLMVQFVSDKVLKQELTKVFLVVELLIKSPHMDRFKFFFRQLIILNDVFVEHFILVIKSLFKILFFHQQSKALVHQ
jgi:hypothetical protein